MHFVYIIYSKKIGKYYVGETSDIEQRLIQHNTGFYKGSFTKQSIDWELKLILSFDSIEQSRAAEAFIKRMNSSKFIERLILDSEWLVEKIKQVSRPEIGLHKK
jgi:putative endonuclease